MSSSDSRLRLVRLGVLAGALLVGAALRLYDLSGGTMTHDEIYIPGISLPYEVSDPRPRLTVVATVVSVIHNEPHPPGYYLLMLGWVRCFGTSLFALRLPSVLFGLGSIVLLAWLASLVRLADAGLAAAALWAINPLAVFMERIGRSYALLCFLGLLSTALLVLAYTSRGRHLAMLGYVLTALAGAFTSVYSWPILFGQLLFTLLGPRGDSPGVAPQARWLGWVASVGSPLLAAAAYASNRPSYLDKDQGGQLMQYFQLLYAWSPYAGRQTFYPAPAWAFPLLAAVVAGLVVVGLVVGVPRRCGTAPGSGADLAGPSRALAYGGAAVALGAIGVFLYLCRKFTDPATVPTGLMLATGVVPLGVVLWEEINRRVPGLVGGWRLGSSPLSVTWLIAVLGVVPVSAVALVSLAVPMLAARTVYSYGPYTILLACLGVLSVSPRWLVRLPVFGALAAVSVTGLLHDRPPHIDYAGLAREIVLGQRPDDVWFVQRHYFVTPLFYHLSAEDQQRLVGAGYAGVLESNPRARVWVVGLEGLEPPREMLEPLRRYRRTERVERRGIYADLYVPAAEAEGTAGPAGTAPAPKGE
jgi:hypothetical protein